MSRVVFYVATGIPRAQSAALAVATVSSKQRAATPVTRSATSASSFNRFSEAIVPCERCPRLRAYCTAIGETRRRAYIDQTYWARPVPGFGDPRARVLILGLAPGAHGANRTGRPFTGDGSGDFMYPVLHELGFATKPRAIRPRRRPQAPPRLDRLRRPLRPARRQASAPGDPQLREHLTDESPRSRASASSSASARSPSTATSPTSSTPGVIAALAPPTGSRHGAEYDTAQRPPPARQLPPLPAQHQHRPAQPRHVRPRLRPRPRTGRSRPIDKSRLPCQRHCSGAPAVTTK